MKKEFIVLTHCRNEARWLNEFLDMCGSISDGVILIDDHSHDNTLEIAKKHPAILNAWKSYQRTDTVSEGCDYIALLSAAQHYNPEWVMIIDADERFDIKQFNNLKTQILNSNYNSISPLWPFYDTIKNKLVYWGWGPNGDRNIVKLKFKHDVIMRYSAVTDCPILPLSHVKPYAKSPQRGFSNLVLKHICVRPVEERIEKWVRRLKAEKEHPSGDPNAVINFIEKLKKLPPKSQSYDSWGEEMVNDFGTSNQIDVNIPLSIHSTPNWELVIPHWSDGIQLMNDKKELRG